MKSYQERLPMIDAAIEYCNGTMKADFLFEVKSGIYYFTSNFNKGSHLNLVCTREEFEHRNAVLKLQNKPKWEDHPDAKCFVQSGNGDWHKNTTTSAVKTNGRCGWSCVDGGFFYIQSGKVIGNWQDTLEKRPETKDKPMKYEYGVEYKTNGRKPDLPDDVLVQVKLDNIIFKNAWLDSSRRVGSSDWSACCTAFRIVDERYKPKEKDMNNWNGDGELPSVGAVVEAMTENKTWIECQVLHHRVNDSGMNVAACMNTRTHRLFWSADFRPLRTETDKLVEQMWDDLFTNEPDVSPQVMGWLRQLHEQGYRKIKPYSEDEFLEHLSLMFGIGSITARKLYQSGFRFIEQGE